jgi:hypothetical protein
VTGWKHVPPIKFLPEGIAEEMGVPHMLSDKSFPSGTLLGQVDREILNRFPRLKDQPLQKIQNRHYQPLLENKGVSSKEAITPSKPLTPYTLYHFIAPPSSHFLKTRDLAFVGLVLSFSTPMIAHVQSAWVSAYFDDKISSLPRNPSSEFMSRFQHEAALHNRFGKWRYPSGFGHSLPDFVFDAVPYLDLLLQDMGLPVHRKGGMLAEITSPYGPEDYATLVDDWKKSQAETGKPWYGWLHTL